MPRFVFILLTATQLLVVRGASADDVPLHVRIDALVGAGDPRFESQVAGMADDAEFQRRVYLDLTGSIPSAEKTREFLADGSPNKRVHLVDRLLNGPAWARRMANFFDVMLMRRMPSKYIPESDWQDWLRSSFASGKPLDQLVREILLADGTNPQMRPAARFLLARDINVNTTTEDIGRLLLGRDMQCAQ